MTKIAIIDYGFGNIKSVANALSFCGACPEIINEPGKISNYGGAILPGVGSFGPAADFLFEKGFAQSLNDYVKSGKMLYGICLGFQLFFSKGYENGGHNGLALLKGEVKKFELEDKNLKIPHIGWNKVEISNAPAAKKMFQGIGSGEDFYFVHSYYAVPEDENKISGLCEYGADFCASVAFDNVSGSQFHPEKSGEKGLMILKNFIKSIA